MAQNGITATKMAPRCTRNAHLKRLEGVGTYLALFLWRLVFFFSHYINFIHFFDFFLHFSCNESFPNSSMAHKCELISYFCCISAVFARLPAPGVTPPATKIASKTMSLCFHGPETVHRGPLLRLTKNGKNIFFVGFKVVLHQTHPKKHK